MSTAVIKIGAQVELSIVENKQLVYMATFGYGSDLLDRLYAALHTSSPSTLDLIFPPVLVAEPEDGQVITEDLDCGKVVVSSEDLRSLNTLALSLGAKTLQVFSGLELYRSLGNGRQLIIVEELPHSQIAVTVMAGVQLLEQHICNPPSLHDLLQGIVHNYPVSELLTVQALANEYVYANTELISEDNPLGCFTTNATCNHIFQVSKQLDLEFNLAMDLSIWSIDDGSPLIAEPEPVHLPNAEALGESTSPVKRKFFSMVARPNYAESVAPTQTAVAVNADVVIVKEETPLVSVGSEDIAGAPSGKLKKVKRVKKEKPMKDLDYVDPEVNDAGFVLRLLSMLVLVLSSLTLGVFAYGAITLPLEHERLQSYNSVQAIRLSYLQGQDVAMDQRLTMLRDLSSSHSKVISTVDKIDLGGKVVSVNFNNNRFTIVASFKTKDGAERLGRLLGQYYRVVDVSTPKVKTVSKQIQYIVSVTCE